MFQKKNPSYRSPDEILYFFANSLQTKVFAFLPYSLTNFYSILSESNEDQFSRFEELLGMP